MVCNVKSDEVRVVVLELDTPLGTYPQIYQIMSEDFQAFRSSGAHKQRP